MSREWDWMDDLNEENYPLKKVKRIKNEHKRNKIKNNRSRTQSGDTANQSGKGGYY